VKKQARAPQQPSQRALQEFIQFWHATFEALSEGIFLCNKEGRVLLCNGAAEASGKRSSEVIGRPCWEIAHKTSRRIRQLPGGPHAQERPQGTPGRPVGDRWLETVVDPMREEGRITGYVQFHIRRHGAEKD